VLIQIYANAQESIVAGVEVALAVLVIGAVLTRLLRLLKG